MTTPTTHASRSSGANERLNRLAPALFSQLSRFGRLLYQARELPAQAMEAQLKATRYNASAGVATSRAALMQIESLSALVPPGVDRDAVVKYAPLCGVRELREAWRSRLLRDHPALEPKSITVPVATHGITHALSVAFDLFVDPGDLVILPDPRWPNYDFMLRDLRGAELAEFSLFDSTGAIDVSGFADAVQTGLGLGHRVHTVANFPHNPTGYTPTASEMSAMADALLQAADRGPLTVICDDAYHGLYHDGACCREGLFARLAGKHPNLVAIRADGATKEYFAWGLRVGFLTVGYAAAGDYEEVAAIVESKVAGRLRGETGSPVGLAQHLLLNAMRDPASEHQLAEFRRELAARWSKVRRELLENAAYAEYWDVYPFNSGYYTCLRLRDANAEALRVDLLERHGVGAMALAQGILRVAYSCLEQGEVANFFERVHQSARELRKTIAKKGG